MPAEICFSALNNCTLNQSWGLLLKTATIYYKSSTVNKRWRFLFLLQFFSGISLSKADSYYNSLFCVIDNPDYWAGVAQTNLYYGQLQQNTNSTTSRENSTVNLLLFRTLNIPWNLWCLLINHINMGCIPWNHRFGGHGLIFFIITLAIQSNITKRSLIKWVP